MRPRFLGLAVLATVVLAAGCRSGPQPAGVPFARPGAPAGAKTDYGYFTPVPLVRPPSVFELDENVARALRQMLTTDPELAKASADVTIDVLRGVATLTGSVPTPGDKKRIVQKLETMPGLDGVNDKLVVRAAR